MVKVSGCLNLDTNINFCNCTYSGCSRRGRCCLCLQYHRRQNQLPACYFPKDAEETYDRSFQKFIEVWS